MTPLTNPSPSIAAMPHTGGRPLRDWPEGAFVFPRLPLLRMPAIKRRFDCMPYTEHLRAVGQSNRKCIPHVCRGKGAQVGGRTIQYVTVERGRDGKGPEIT